MQKIWFGIAKFLEATFDWLLTPFGWFPVISFILILAFGFVYWMVLQNRYNQEARRKGGLI